MFPYFLLIFLPTVLWVIGNKYSVNVGNRILFQSQSGSIDIFMLIFLLLLAFRGLLCGSDTEQYFHLYNEYASSNLTEVFAGYRQEIGFILLNVIVARVFGNYQVFLAISAFLCVWPLWYYYKRESENALLTIALFLTVAPFVMYFSGIRQAIAMSIGIFSWYAAKNKKLVRFILLVLLAVSFHTSAFILFVLYPLYHLKITKHGVWLVIPIILAVYYFRVPIFDFLLQFLWQEYETTEETGAVTILLLLIIFAIYSYVMVDDKSLDRDTVAMRNILLLSIVIQIFAMLHPLSMRMNYYFLIYVPVLIPKIANRCKEKYREVGKLSVVVMTVFFIGYFIKDMITDNDALNVFPYIPFWQNPQ